MRTYKDLSDENLQELIDNGFTNDQIKQLTPEQIDRAFPPKGVLENVQNFANDIIQNPKKPTTKIANALDLLRGAASQAILDPKKFKDYSVSQSVTQGSPTVGQLVSQPNYKAPNFLAEGYKNAYQNTPDFLKPVADLALTASNDPFVLADVGGLLGRLKGAAPVAKVAEAATAVNPARIIGTPAELVNKGLYRLPEINTDIKVSGGVNRALRGENIAPTMASYEQGQILSGPNAYRRSASKISKEVAPIYESAAGNYVDENGLLQPKIMIDQGPIKQKLEEQFLNPYKDQGMFPPNPEVAQEVADAKNKMQNKIDFETSSAGGEAQRQQNLLRLKLANEYANKQLDWLAKAKNGLIEPVPVMPKILGEDPKVFKTQVPMAQEVARNIRRSNEITPSSYLISPSRVDRANDQFYKALLAESKSSIRDEMGALGIANPDELYSKAKAQQALLEAANKSNARVHINPLSPRDVIAAAGKDIPSVLIRTPTSLFGSARRAAPNFVDAMMRELLLRNLNDENRGNYILQGE